MNQELYSSSALQLFMAVSSFFIGFIFISFIVLTKSKNWCIITFTVGKIFQAIGILGFSLWFSVPHFISLTLGSIFLFIGYAFETFGITSFDLILRKKKVYTITLSTLVFIAITLITKDNPDYQKAMIFSFAGMSYFGYGGIYLALFSEHSKFKKWIGYTYTFFALVYACNLISIFIQGENFQLFNSDRILNIILNLTAYLVVLLGSVGLLLILREQNVKIILNDNIELKKLNSTKDKFFSIIAHDLRSPIGSLYQLIQLIVVEQNEISPRDRQNLLNEIYENSKNTFELLENLLQWSRAESGRLTYTPTMINLHEIAGSTIKLFKDNIRNKNQSVALKIDADAAAYADENMVKTVFRNLVSNAIKFTPKDGKITIGASEDKENFIKISITDTGVGIDKDALSQIFDSEFAYSTEGTNMESGTGLGLKLCKEFIQSNKGELSVESEFNKGSTSSFTLPVNDPQNTYE